MIDRKKVMWWRVWGITPRPWWMHRRKGRTWRRALTLAFIAALTSGCAGVRRCDEMNATDCSQLKDDYAKAVQQTTAPVVSYHYGEGKQPTWGATQ